MRVFAAGRQTGKTERAIRWASDSCAHIVCRSRKEAERIYHRAKEMNLEILFPITYQQFLRGSPEGVAKKYVVDDADALIAELANGAPVLGVTINSDYVISSELSEEEPKEEPRGPRSILL